MVSQCCRWTRAIVQLHRDAECTSSNDQRQRCPYEQWHRWGHIRNTRADVRRTSVERRFCRWFQPACGVRVQRVVHHKAMCRRIISENMKPRSYDDCPVRTSTTANESMQREHNASHKQRGAQNKLAHTHRAARSTHKATTPCKPQRESSQKSHARCKAFNKRVAKLEQVCSFGHREKSKNLQKQYLTSACVRDVWNGSKK